MKKNLDLARLLTVKRKFHQLVLKDLDLEAREKLKAQVDELLAPLLAAEEATQTEQNDFTQAKIALPLLYAQRWPDNQAVRLEQLLYRDFSHFYSAGEIDQIIDQLSSST